MTWNHDDRGNHVPDKFRDLGSEGCVNIRAAAGDKVRGFRDRKKNSAMLKRELPGTDSDPLLSLPETHLTDRLSAGYPASTTSIHLFPKIGRARDNTSTRFTRTRRMVIYSRADLLTLGSWRHGWWPFRHVYRCRQRDSSF